MNHLEFAELESQLAAGTHADRDWAQWVRDVERLLGGNIDGDDGENGYSLDEGYDCWRAKLSAESFVTMIQARPNFVLRTD